MTLKIGLDVQFIKTERAGGDFSESTVVTAQKREGERGGGCHLNELKKSQAAIPIFKSYQ